MLTDQEIAAAVRPLYSSAYLAQLGLRDDIATARAVLAAAQAKNEPAAMVRRLLADERPTVDGMLCAVVVPGAMYADVWPARWNAEQGNFDAAAGWFEADEVIAWMPLPVAPSQEGDAP